MDAAVAHLTVEQRLAKGTFVNLSSTGLQEFIDRASAGRTRLRILEAGCGSRSNLRFPADAHWVGIDISQAQLDRNTGLDEKIQGDIQTHAFPAESFDIVVCWDVLEHLERPREAMERFAESIRRDGLIILKIPNVQSVKGLVTKFLPHRAHVLWYQYMRGREFTNIVDGAPFKAYLRLEIAPISLRRFAAGYGFEVPLAAYYDVSSVDWFRRKKFALVAYRFVFWLARVISLGALRESEFIIIMKRTR